METIKLLAVITLLTFFISCEKTSPEPDPNPPIEEEDEKLTEATTTGENTLSFLLNEEVWVPTSGPFNLEATISDNSNQVLIGANKRNFETDPGGIISIAFVLDSIGSLDLINSNIRGLNSSFSFGSFFTECINTYRTIQLDTFNRININHLNFSQKPLENILSGTFQLRLIETESLCKDTLIIKDGRFDLVFQPVP